MTKLEQRCKGVAKVFDDFNIKYKMKYNNPQHLHFIYQGRGWDVEITNRYITVEYSRALRLRKFFAIILWNNRI